MKKSIIYLGILFPFLSFGQNDTIHPTPARNTIYIEAFGQGLLNSFSFDRLYCLHKKVKTSLTVGVTLVPVIGIGDFYTGIQTSYDFLFKVKNHHLELGAGLNVLIDKEKIGVEYFGQKGIQQNYYSYITPKLGYRFQKEQGGIFLRLTFTPLFALINKTGQINIANELVVHSRYEFFTNVVSFGNKAFPWGGISIGYTFKNRKSK